MNKIIRITRIAICAIVTMAYAENDHAQESVEALREPVISALHYLFNEEQAVAIQRQAGELQKKRHQKITRAMEAHINTIQEEIDQLQDQLENHAATLDEDDKHEMRTIITYGKERISNVAARIPDVSIPVGKYIWESVSRTVQQMDKEERLTFVLKAIDLITEREDERINTKLLDIIMRGRFLAPYVDHRIVRRFLFELLDNEDRRLRARRIILDSLETPTTEERDYVVNMIRQGCYDLMDMAIKWRFNGDLNQYIASLVANDEQRLASEQVSIYWHYLVDRDEIPRVEYYDERREKVYIVPLLSMPDGVEFTALDLAHTYLATLGDANSVTWLQQEYQKFKVPGHVQPGDAYVYFVLLYLTGNPPDGPIRKESNILE